MTGRVNVDTIAKADGTSAVDTEYVTGGSAKVWCCLNGTGTIAIRDSFNTASVTDNGTGDYTYNYTTAMASADYSFAGGPGSTANGGMALTSTGLAPSATQVRLVWNRPGVANYDTNPANLIVQGDLS